MLVKKIILTTLLVALLTALLTASVYVQDPTSTSSACDNMEYQQKYVKSQYQLSVQKGQQSDDECFCAVGIQDRKNRNDPIKPSTENCPTETSTED